MGESPAVARRRVRLALRAARKAKGLTQTQVADAMDWSLSKVMRIESGEVNVSVSDLRVLLPYLDLADSDEAQRLIEDAKIARRERYSVDPLYREHLSPALLQLMQFEQEATEIRYFHPLLVPGLHGGRADRPAGSVRRAGHGRRTGRHPVPGEPALGRDRTEPPGDHRASRHF